MTRRLIAALGALSAALLAGCGVLHPPEHSAPPERAPAAATPAALPPVKSAPERSDEGAQLAGLLAVSRNFANMKSEDQKQEVNDAAQGFNRDKSAFARLKLAMLLAVPGTGVDDEARAATLLEPMLAAPPAGPLQEMAVFLSAQLAERARERKRTAQYKDQLDALKAVERSLIERSQGKAK